MNELLNILGAIILAFILFGILGHVKEKILEGIESARENRLKESLERKRKIWEIELHKIKKGYPIIEKDIPEFCDYLNRLPEEKIHSKSTQIISILQLKEESNTPVNQILIADIIERYEAFLDYKELSIKRETVVDQLITTIEMKKRTLDYWRKLSPDSFEREVLNLFERLGYKTSGTPYVADGDIDGILKKEDKKIIIQCKKHEKPIGVQVVRDIYGTMFHNKANEGWVVSISNFTRYAHEFAKDKPIELIGFEELLAFASKAFPVTNDEVRSSLLNKLSSISKEIIEKHGEKNLNILTKKETDFFLSVKFPWLFTK